MAGEKKGKTCEAFFCVALKELQRQKCFSGEIFWNEKPEGMSIEPDFTIGKDKNKPAILFMITHSGSAGDSHKKFWRNMGELVEAKTNKGISIKVFSIVFDSIIKEDLKKVQENSFDGQLIIGDQKYGQKIQTWVETYVEELPQDALKKVETIEKWLQTNDPRSPRQLLQELTKDLKKLFASSRPELDQLWQMERKRPKGQAPHPRDTFIRRGLSKLMIFEDLDLALSLYRGQRVLLKEVPGYAFETGLAKKALGCAKPGDPEIQNAVNLLTDKQIREILSEIPEAMNTWLEMIRESEMLVIMGEYVQKEFENLKKTTVLCQRLNELHDNPKALIKGSNLPKNWPPGTVWLLEYLIELIRSASGSANGYGYAQMEREASHFKNMPPAGAPIYRIDLPAWVHRKELKIFPTGFMDGLSHELCNKLTHVSVEKLCALTKAIPHNLTQNLIEAKLVTYRMFAPLRDLIAKSMPQVRIKQIRAWMAEAAGVGGQAGKTQVLQVKNTLINWQSAHAGHTNDKKKELCGRAVALRYSWDADKKQFVTRPGVKKLILVVDGTWRQKDLDALTRSGWDAIFYPDEMSELAKAIE